jgi:hypothetical protein
MVDEQIPIFWKGSCLNHNPVLRPSSNPGKDQNRMIELIAFIRKPWLNVNKLAQTTTCNFIDDQMMNFV